MTHGYSRNRRILTVGTLTVLLVLSVFALGFAGTAAATAVDDSAVDDTYDGLVASTPADGDATSASHVVTVPVGSTLAGEEVTRINVTYPDFVDADNIGSSSEVTVEVLSGGSVSDTDTIGAVNEPGGNNNVEVDLSSTTTTLSQGDIVRVQFTGNGSIDQSGASATSFTVDTAEVTLSAPDIEQEQSNDVDFPLNGPIEADDGSSTQTYVSLHEAVAFADSTNSDPSINVLNVGALDGNALDETLTQNTDLPSQDAVSQIKIDNSFGGTFDINGNDETIGTPVNDGTPIFEIAAGSGGAVDIDNLVLDAEGGAVTPTTKNKQALKMTDINGQVTVSDSDFDNTGQGSNPTLEINDDGNNVKVNNTRLDGGVGVEDKSISGFGGATLNVTNNDVVNVGGNDGIDLQSTGGTLVVDQNTISGVSGGNTGLNLDIASGTTLQSADGATRQITGNDITMSGGSTGISIAANQRDQNITLVNTQVQGDKSSDDTGVTYSTTSGTGGNNNIDFNITETGSGTTEIGPVRTVLDISSLGDDGSADHDVIVKNGANLTTSDDSGNGVVLSAGVGSAGDNSLGIDVVVDNAIIAGPEGSPGGDGIVLKDGTSNKVIQSLTVDPDTDTTGAGTTFKNLDRGIVIGETAAEPLVINRRASGFSDGKGKISGSEFLDIQDTAIDADHTAINGGSPDTGIGGAANNSLSGNLNELRFENIDIVLDSASAEGIDLKPGNGGATDIARFADISVSATPGTTGQAGIIFSEASDSTTFDFDPNVETIADVTNGVNVVDANKIRQDRIVDTDGSTTFDSIGGSALLLADIGTTTDLTINQVSATDDRDNNGAVVDLDDNDVNNLVVTRADFGSDGSGGITTPVGTGINTVDASNAQTVTVTDADIGVESTGITTSSSDDLILAGSTNGISGDVLIEGVDAGTAISADGTKLEIQDDVSVEVREHSQAPAATSYGFTNGIDAADVNLDPGSDDTLDSLTFTEMQSGTALDIDSLTGLSGSTLTIDDSSGSTFTVESATGGTKALEYSAAEALTVTEPTLGANDPVATGLDITGATNNKVTIDSADISLANSGTTGISAEPTNAEVEFQNSLTINGPSISATGDHAGAGVTVDSNALTLTSLGGSDDFNINGVDKGFHIRGASSVDDFRSVDFTDIGGTASADAALQVTGGSQTVDVQDITVEFAHPESNDGIAVHSTSGDLDVDNAAISQTAGTNAPDAGIRYADGSNDLSLDTDATTDQAISNSSISDVEEGVDVTAANDVDDIEGTSFTAIGSKAIDIDSPSGLSSSVVKFEITVDGDSASATGIEFDESSNTGITVDSKSNIGYQNGAGVDTGVDVAAAGDTVTVEPGTQIGLASGASDGVLLDYAQDNTANVNGITVEGSGAGDGVELGSSLSSISGPNSINFDTTGASTITNVDQGLVVADGALGGSDTLSDISGTTFDNVGTDAIEATGLNLGGATLIVDNIAVENSPSATAINADFSDSNADDLTVKNSQLGTTGDVKSGIVFAGAESSTGKLDVQDVNVTLADDTGFGVEFTEVDGGDTAENLVIDGFSVNGSGSTGIKVDDNSGGAQINGLDTVAFINDTDDGIDIQGASNLQNNELKNIAFDDIGKSGSGGAAVSISDSLGGSPTITNLDIGLDDVSTVTGLSLGSDNDYSVSNINVSGTGATTGTGVDFTTSGSVDFDAGVSSSSASDISGVSVGVDHGSGTVAGAGATVGGAVNNTQFSDIGSKALEYSPSGFSGGQHSVAGVSVDSSSAATAVEFDGSSTNLNIKNIDTGSSSVQVGVNVEAANNEINVTDSSITVTDDADAVGILVDSSSTAVGIERNGIDSAASSDGTGSAIALENFDGSGSSLIYLNDLEGFTATDDKGAPTGFALNGSSVANLGEERAIANYYGDDNGPNNATGSNVDLNVDTVSPGEVRIYDPFLTSDTAQIADNAGADLEDVTINQIRDYAHGLTIRPGSQVAFPGDSARELQNAYSGNSTEGAEQVFEYNPSTDQYEEVNDETAKPQALDTLAFTFENSNANETLAIEYSDSAANERVVNYEQGANLVASASSIELNSSTSSEVSSGTAVNATETFGLTRIPDSELSQNVTIAPIDSAVDAPHGQELRTDPVDPTAYDSANDINDKVSPFAPTFVFIDQDSEDIDDDLKKRSLTPSTMDTVVDRGDQKSEYAFESGS